MHSRLGFGFCSVARIGFGQCLETLNSRRSRFELSEPKRPGCAGLDTSPSSMLLETNVYLLPVKIDSVLSIEISKVIFHCGLSLSDVCTRDDV